jgi:hypothetical protein
MPKAVFPPFTLAQINPEWACLSGPYGDFAANDLTAGSGKLARSCLHIDPARCQFMDPKPLPVKKVRVYLTLWAPDSVLDEVARIQDLAQTIQGKSCRISLSRSVRFTEFDRQLYRAFRHDELACPPPLYVTRKVLEFTLEGFSPSLREPLTVAMQEIHSAFDAYSWAVGFPLPAMEVIRDQRLSPQYLNIDGIYRHRLVKMDENTLFVEARTAAGKRIRIDPEQCVGSQYDNREKLETYDAYRLEELPADGAPEVPELTEASRLRELSVADPARLAERVRQTCRWPTWADFDLLLEALPLIGVYSITLEDVVLTREMTPALKRRIAEHRFSQYGWFLRDQDRMTLLAGAWDFIPVVVLEFAVEQALPPVFAANVLDYLCAYLASFFPTALLLVSRSTLTALGGPS